jgi:hypothetical protein
MKEIKIQNLLNISPEDTIKSLEDVQKAHSPQKLPNMQKRTVGTK